jgi:hypothetical protein
MGAKERKTLAGNGLISQNSSQAEVLESDKWIQAQKRSKHTDKWTEILFRALSNRVAKRWRFVSFRGAQGGEWCGIVDVIAIRKDTTKSHHEIIKSGDLFEMILGVCPSNPKIAKFGGTKTITELPIVDSGASCEVDFLRATLLGQAPSADERGIS